MNKYLHTVAFIGFFLFTLNYDARNHELKKINHVYLPNCVLSEAWYVIISDV